MNDIRTDWTLDEVRSIYHKPLMELVYEAATMHRKYQATGEVQVCTLLSVKTGGCEEDCSYCPQSKYFSTGVDAEKLMPVNEVLEAAVRAKEAGSTRFCMGAAWRNARKGRDFDQVLEMVKGVKQLGMEVCVTLGMVSKEQAEKLKEAGLYAYNHNLDSSESFYSEIISTRTYKDRLNTLENVRDAGISVCCGGIIGMGETDDDRIGLLHTLATLPVHPESVPVNALVAVDGTPLEGRERVKIWEMVRMIATARLLMPKALVRLSAGRVNMSEIEQAFCFMAGANSIFAGEKLLTTPNPGYDADAAMFKTLGLQPRIAYKTELADYGHDDKLMFEEIVNA
jgi:biotin synthase